MHFHALAADYDGTLAKHGAVDAETLDGLKRLRASGRRLILVTGREMADLRHALPEVALFERIVAENGGVLHDPATGRERVLAPAPPAALVQRLMESGVEPISVGRTIVATWSPHEKEALAAIASLGLELQITFNKGAVMVLPAGVTKATGLKAALEELEMSPLNVVGIGDAENDHAFLRICGASAAVANAIPAVRRACDIALVGERGAGVVELIDRILEEDACLLPASRIGVHVCTARNGARTYLRPQVSLLIAGGSGSGKSRFVTHLTERMIERRQEFSLVDPEGDYDRLEGAIKIGDEAWPPSIDETVGLLGRTDLSIVVSTMALDLAGRRRFFDRLLPALLDLRARTGRPHWLIVDEAHHFLPRIDGKASAASGRDLAGTVLVTMEPGWLARDVLAGIDVLLALGRGASGAVAAFAREAGLAAPLGRRCRPDEALLLRRADPSACRPVRIGAPQQDHERHKGKYAVGNVGWERSFTFTDKNGRSLGVAANLAAFVSLAHEVPDTVWDRHLRAAISRRGFSTSSGTRSSPSGPCFMPGSNRTRSIRDGGSSTRSASATSSRIGSPRDAATERITGQSRRIIHGDQESPASAGRDRGHGGARRLRFPGRSRAPGAGAGAGARAAAVRSRVRRPGRKRRSPARSPGRGARGEGAGARRPRRSLSATGPRRHCRRRRDRRHGGACRPAVGHRGDRGGRPLRRGRLGRGARRRALPERAAGPPRAAHGRLGERLRPGRHRVEGEHRVCAGGCGGAALPPAGARGAFGNGG
jgi:HAD superfamily hydrolase (TIGR01484 family)